jgi:hypothetical protein
MVVIPGHNSAGFSDSQRHGVIFWFRGIRPTTGLVISKALEAWKKGSNPWHRNRWDSQPNEDSPRSDIILNSWFQRDSPITCSLTRQKWLREALNFPHSETRSRTTSTFDCIQSLTCLINPHSTIICLKFVLYPYQVTSILTKMSDSPSNSPSELSSSLLLGNGSTTIQSNTFRSWTRQQILARELQVYKVADLQVYYKDIPYDFSYHLMKRFCKELKKPAWSCG